MDNILVTGSDGQLGSEIKALASGYGYNFLFASKDKLDITDKLNIENFIRQYNITIVINCASYTAVDKAEDEQEIANKINNTAVNYLAYLSLIYNIKLIHISTDYVFDGKNNKPYSEDDIVSPISIYGQTKLDGENKMLSYNLQKSIIIRTSWLYSSFGNNFVKTMLSFEKKQKSLGVVYDQIGTPTYARDLAKVILDIIPQINDKSTQIYHYSNGGVISRYDFAKAIFEISNVDVKVYPIETKNYLTKAIRPQYSVLNKFKIEEKFDITVPYWKDSLKRCLEKIDE